MMQEFKLICSSLVVGSLISCSTAPPAKPIKADSVQSQANSPATVIVSFKNERGDVRVALDPNDEDLYLDFKASKKPDPSLNKDSVMNLLKAKQSATQELSSGFQMSAKVKPDTVVKIDTVKIDSLMWKNLKGVESKEAQKAIGLIQQAQEKFYKKDYDSARDMLNQSLKILPTPDAYALLGTISYVAQNKIGAKFYWQKSLELDPNQAKVRKALDGLGGE